MTYPNVTDSLAFSPTAYQYFMNAYQMPNVNAYQNYGNNNTTAAKKSEPVVQSNISLPLTTGSNIQFKGKEKEKNSGAAWGIIVTVATISAAALCRKAYVKGHAENKKIIQSIGDGFKELWQGVAKKYSKYLEKPTVTKVGNTAVCTIPNRTNKLKGTDVASAAERLGIKTTASLADKASTLRRYTFDIDGCVVEIHKNKIVSCTKDGAPKDIGKKLKAKIEAQVAKFNNHEDLDKLRNVTFDNNVGNAKRRFYLADPGNTPELQIVTTRNFAADSDAIKAYGISHKNFAESLEKFGKGDFDNLKILTAESKQKFGTILIEGDKIVGVKDAAGAIHKVGSDRYTVLENQHSKLFEKILKDKEFTNVVYAA